MDAVALNYSLKIAGNTSTLSCAQACDPQIVSHNRFSIIIAMPAPVCMCGIHNIKFTMSKAGLPEN